jgi:hypothetical protein
MKGQKDVRRQREKGGRSKYKKPKKGKHILIDDIHLFLCLVLYILVVLKEKTRKEK